MEKKLFRNEHDKVIAGIASGLATYLQVDVTIVRLLFILSTLFLAGAGLVAYIVMWIIVPSTADSFVNFDKFKEYYQKPDPSTMFNSPNAFSNPANTQQTKWNTPNSDSSVGQSVNENINKMKNNNQKGRTITGLVLLLLGIYFLLRQFDLIPHWFNIFKIYKLWPLAIIGVGISLILKNKQKNEWEEFKKNTEAAQNSPTFTGTQTTVDPEKDTTTPNV
jgi:phage shock protein C